jgi:hypothetical protein
MSLIMFTASDSAWKLPLTVTRVGSVLCAQYKITDRDNVNPAVVMGERTRTM